MKRLKRLIVLVLIVAGLIGGAIVSAPFIASTDLAKRRIAAQVEEWTGRPVAFTGEPRVKLFPFLSLTIDNARIADAEGSSDEPLVEMEQLTCKLRLLPFLIGRTEVAEFQLVRPRFHLTVDEGGRANWLPRRQESPAEGENAASPTSRQMADIRIGRFKIFDGIVSYEDKRSGRREELNEVALSLVWPSIAKAVSGTGSFSWRDETVEFNVSVSEPLSLIDGGRSPARFAVASKPLRLAFTGLAEGLAEPRLEGSARVTAPSVRRVAEWLVRPMGSGPILGAAQIEGTLNWSSRALSLAAARVELDGNSAEGALSIDLARERPKLSGTLAIEKLDLTAYLEAFQATVASEGPWPLTSIGMPLIDAADADVRLSAGQILLGTTRLGKTAIAAVVADGKLGIDVGEAQFYGGRATGRIAAAIGDDGMTASVAIGIEDAPAGAVLRDAAGLTLLDGTISTTIEATARGESFGEFIDAIAGRAEIEIVDGVLSGLELGRLATLAGGRGVVDPAAGSGTIPFASMTGRLTLANGGIRATDIRVEGQDFSIDLAGGLSLINAAVRAKGVLAAAYVGGEPGSRREVPFVIGGFWDNPLLLPDYEQLIERGAEAPQPASPGRSASRPPQTNG